jgi:hypothetical protein
METGQHTYELMAGLDRACDKLYEKALDLELLVRIPLVYLRSFEMPSMKERRFTYKLAVESN